MYSQNLYYLRKRDKITQEELADRLGVSRQAVSKWETGEAYPETEKLIVLCDYFRISIDSFLRSDLSQTATQAGDGAGGVVASGTNTEDSDREDGERVPVPMRRKHVHAFARAVSVGVFLIMIGVAACVAFGGHASSLDPSKSDVWAVAGVAVLLAFIAAAVFLFVFFGVRYDTLNRQCGGNIDCAFSAAEQERFGKRFAVAIACLIGAILADVIALIVLSTLIDGGGLHVRHADAAYAYTFAGFFTVLAFLVGGLTYGGMLHERYFPKPVQTDKKRKTVDAVCGALMLTCTAVFLLLGFGFDRWHPSWVVFPIGGVLCAIVQTVSNAFSPKEDTYNKKSDDDKKEK